MSQSTPSRMTVSRRVAYDALVQVLDSHLDANTASERFLAQESLSDVDRRFVKEMLFGALRWYSKVHWILKNTAKRDLDRSDVVVQAALVMGAYQIFYMDRVPDRAAVNESVEYVRSRGLFPAVSFVNGILRNIARRAEYFPKPDKDSAPVDYYSIQFAHPKWMVRRWWGRFNPERLKTILAANNTSPSCVLRINTHKVGEDSVQNLREQLLRDDRCHSERRPLRSVLRLNRFPSLSACEAFEKGLVSVQDEASQLVANLVRIADAACVVDACCGRGTKTLHLQEIAKGEANIIGMDVSASQLALAKQSQNRLGLGNITWLQQDFLDFTPQHPVDRILLDAPCSGLGVLRRYPEGKLHKPVDLVSTMARKQRALLEHALRILEPGGELVFSVCSFELEEAQNQLAWLRDTYGDKISVVSIADRIPSYYGRYVDRHGLLQIYSGNTDRMDGFSAFAIKLESAIGEAG